MTSNIVFTSVSYLLGYLFDDLMLPFLLLSLIELLQFFKYNLVNITVRT